MGGRTELSCSIEKDAQGRLTVDTNKRHLPQVFVAVDSTNSICMLCAKESGALEARCESDFQGRVNSRCLEPTIYCACFHCFPVGLTEMVHFHHEQNV